MTKIAGSERWIWIDALCINQRDDEEKNIQVMNMINIYRQASQVLVWFGPAHITIGRTFDFIKLITSEYSSERVNTEQYLAANEALNQLLSMTGDGKDVWMHGIKRITGNAWWRRIWVLQEVAVARKVLVLHGSYRLNFDYLQKFWELLGANREHAPGYLARVRNNMQMLLNSCNAITTRSHDFFSVLRAVHSTIFEEKFFQASNRKDYVYALAGASEDKFKISTINYSKTCSEVYVEATADLIGKHGLDVLSMCKMDPETISLRAELMDLPSWAINWSRPIWIQNHLGDIDQKGNLKRLYSASGTINSSNRLHVQTESKLLVVSGSIIDMIAKTTGTTTRYTISQWIEDICGLIGELCQKKPLTKATQENLVLRTAVADCISSLYMTDRRRFRNSDVLELSDLRSYIQQKLNGNSSEFIMTRTGWYFPTLRELSDYGQPILSKNYRIGIAPRACQVGDLICLIQGASTPFVLRKRNKGGYWLLGWVYLHGVMDGELMADSQEPEIFTIH
jgi:hypothetical protein